MPIILTEKRTDSLPVQYAKRVLGIQLWSKQIDVLLSTMNNRYTAVRSCHEAGKSFLAAVAMHTFLGLNERSIVVTTAPTFNQVKNILWREFRKIYNRSLIHKKMAGGYGGFLNQTDFSIDEDWYAIGLSPRDTDEERIQGFHTESGNFLFIGDEAPGCSRIIIDAADTSLMVSPNAHMLLIGNPTESVGHFYECFKDSDYEKFKIAFEDTPNAKAGYDKIPFLITHVWVERMRKKWGEDHPFFINKVKANFTDTGINSIISLADVERSMMEEKPQDKKGQKVLGVDVAREGDDLSVIAFRQGNEILKLICFSKQDTVELANWVVLSMKEFEPEHPESVQVNVDTIGVGAGVFDNLKNWGYRNIKSVKVSRAPTRRKAKRVRAGEEEWGQEFLDDFYSLKEEIWWGVREKLARSEILLCDDEELKSDLIAPRWSPVNGKIRMEEKKETKKRLGRSPDKGDAIMLAFAQAPPQIRIL